ncbi:MAG: alpha amylase C-terminal domain-containing protein [Phycisphaeraceae bacterium]|nr:MAG: alpha amylase C-terminal domain-containing protein [Phycisphaeraceae bacterium]
MLKTLGVCALGAMAGHALAATHDNNVEWDGLSHVGWQDRSPRVPMDGEAFVVRFQAYRGDLTSASALWDDGTSHAAAATVVATRGPYDIWQASIPSTATTTLSYVIEAVDGTDADYLGPSGVRDNPPPDAWTLDFATLTHAPYGSTPVDGGTVFRVWAPSRSTCAVRGEFNNWSTANPIAKVGEDFVGFVPGAHAGQMYKYYFSGGIWKPDARAEQLVPTDNYNSVIVDQDDYAWQTQGFSPAPLEQMVVYQLHVGSFSGRNDPHGSAPNPSRYIDVANRVDHLEELGVNAVMLNPINEFPGDFSGGYNPISAWAVESKLGTVDDFKAMVDALHGAGIAVLLDIVWNHFAGNENYLWNYDGTQIYYDSPAVSTPWGDQHDFDDANVRDYFADSIDLFLGDYRLDGYRVDAVMAMTDSGWTPQWGSGQTLMRRLNDHVDNRFADRHVIAEQYNDDTWTVGATPGGLGFDAQYHNAFKNAIRAAAYAEAGGGSPNMGSLAATLDGTGGSVGSKALNYFELHDDAWPLNGHQRAVTEWNPSSPGSDESRGLQTLANGLTLTAKGVPAILQGTAWLEDEGWEANKIDWSHKTTYAGVFAFYRDLIHLRTSKPSLWADSPISVYHVNEGGDVMAFGRWGDDGRSYVIVANISNVAYPQYLLGLPRAGAWGVLINNDATQYGGHGVGTAGMFQTEAVPRDGFDQRATLSIPAYGFMVLQYDPEFQGCNAADIADPLGTLDLADIAAFTSAFIAQGAAADIDGNGVWDLGDIGAFIEAFTGGCP